MKKNLTELVFILDRSGSMGGLEQDTIGGFNAMLTRQKEQEGEANVTTILFDRAVRFENDAQGVAVNYHVVSETVSRMREAPCCASIGAEWKEQIEADFQKRHHR